MAVAEHELRPAVIVHRHAGLAGAAGWRAMAGREVVLHG